MLYCMISGGVFGRGGKGGGRSKCTRDIAYPEWQGGDMHCGHLDQYLDWRLMKLRSSDTILADPVVLVTLAPVNSLPREKLQTNSRSSTRHVQQHQQSPTKRMVTRKVHKGKSGTSKTVIETKATSTTGDNLKYKTPKPQIPATDPKYIQNLWYQVRNQTREKMSHEQLPKYMVHTRSTEAKEKMRRTATPTTSGVLSTTSTSPTWHAHSISIKSPLFRDKCLVPRGISINHKGVPPPDPFSHFLTTKPSSYQELDGLKESTLWLNTNLAFIESINKEYKFMDHHQLCEAEYASFAKENLLKREPREDLSDNIVDESQRFRRAERMLEFVCKPDDEWEIPPFLSPPSSSENQEYPTYTFDVRPDCSYWLSLHAFSSRYIEQAQTFLHVPQNRITCPYFTIEFKRDDMGMEKAIDQAATFGALALHNRYRLRNRVFSDKWTHEQECQLRHYVLIITKSKYKFWCIRPNLQEDGRWNGCTMTMIFVALLTSKQGVRSFVDWINEIHRWGLTNHVESCQRDIKSTVRKHDYRVSSEGLTSKECTCQDSLDTHIDTRGTSE